MEKTDNRRELKIVAVVTLIVTVLTVLVAVIVLLSKKKDTPQIPWYQDYNNIRYVFEDERSEEKSVSYTGASNNSEPLTFHYESTIGNTKNYIPDYKIFYKGDRQNIYVKINIIEKFPYDANGPDYTRPEWMNGMVSTGYYRVTLYAFLTKEDEKEFNNPIAGNVIFINVDVK